MPIPARSNISEAAFTCSGSPPCDAHINARWRSSRANRSAPPASKPGNACSHFAPDRMKQGASMSPAWAATSPCRKTQYAPRCSDSNPAPLPALSRIGFTMFLSSARPIVKDPRTRQTAHPPHQSRKSRLCHSFRPSEGPDPPRPQLQRNQLTKPTIRTEVRRSPGSTRHWTCLGGGLKRYPSHATSPFSGGLRVGLGPPGRGRTLATNTPTT